MLLIFDIGNTNIKAAIILNDLIVNEWRISTNTSRTGDEYFSVLSSLFKDANIDLTKIENVVISSVVPSLIGAFVHVSRNITGLKPLIIGPEIYNKLPIKIPETATHEIGTDLLCNALEAWCRYKTAVIAVDFGTALSFTAVNDKGEIAGIAIAPGIGTAFKSLFLNTAQLPSVPLEVPNSSLGKNTTESIQSGIILGYKGLVEGLILRMKDDLVKECNANKSKIRVIATGGLNSMLQPITDIFNEVDKNLTIKGIVKAANFIK